MKHLLLFTLALLAGATSYSQHDYPKAQHMSTYFNGAQRCGDTQSWIHPEAGCHMTDGQKEGVDLTGGWHDCGDYIKFHVTGPYTALTLLYGFDKYPEAYPDDYSQAFSAPPSNGIPDVLDEVKIETDYLIKCVNGNTIYWQVGAGVDHNSFSDPVTHGKEKLYNGSEVRTVYAATSGHSNAFGTAASALALMSILYEPYSSTYADSCLQAAISYYNIGNISPSSTADAENNFYSFLTGSTRYYQDEMGMGAIMLYRATSTESYLTEAKAFAAALYEFDVTFNYSALNHLLYLELYQQTQQQSYLDLIDYLMDDYSLTSCGYYHRTSWGSVRDAGNAAMISCLHHMFTNDQTSYDFAKSNVDFILGSHDAFSNIPANFSFMVGYNELGGGFPPYPHHAAAFGKNGWTDYNKEKASPGSVAFAYELKGGLAGGPESSCGQFNTNIDNYVSNEFCSYYNAALTGALAYVNKIENNITIDNYVDEVNGLKAFIVYPNPANEVLQFNNIEIIDLVVFDLAGRTIEIVQLGTNGNLDISNYNDGTYLIQDTKTGKYQKFVKVK